MIAPLDLAWTVILVLVAWPLFQATARAAMRGNFATDAIASLAILTSIVLVEPLPGFIIVLMQTGGESLERMARGRASHALRELEAAAPRFAHRRTAAGTADVAVSELEPGDHILILPGEVLPADGVVLEGQSHVDTAQITGEPVPVSARAGTELVSGYSNLDGPLVLRVSHPPAESQYARIVELVRIAQQEKAPIQRLADRYAVWFTPIVVLVALGAWFASGDPMRVLAVLVVATPCPLILATPVAILGGINQSAKQKIIVRSGAALENLARTRAIAFDKTGTLTTGIPAAHEVLPQPGWTEEELLRTAAAVESGSGHPLARAIIAAAERRALTVTMADQVREAAGSGVRGTVDGRVVAVGSRDFIAAVIQDENGPPSLNGARLTSFIAIDGVFAGRIQFDDEIRADAVAMVRALRTEGKIKHFSILSGDDAKTVDAAAYQLGISDAHGNLKPEQKIELLRRMQARAGSTMMVGDGTNDAPALAAADVGLAVAPRGGGIATEAADVILLSEDLIRIRDALVISRRTLHIAKQSIWIGLGLSGAGMVAAALGWLPPIAGALVQEGIDVGVILNALRASSFKPQYLQREVAHANADHDSARRLGIRRAGDPLRGRVGRPLQRDRASGQGAPAA